MSEPIHKTFSHERLAVCGEWTTTHGFWSNNWDFVTCEKCLHLMSEHTKKIRARRLKAKQAEISKIEKEV